MQSIWKFLFFSVIALMAEPARAQTINLYCTNPNLRYSYFLDVDYAASTVTYRMDAAGLPGTVHQARITDNQITWEVPPAFRGDGRMVHTVNRITGQLNSCDSIEGCFQRVCKPAQRQF